MPDTVILTVSNAVAHLELNRPEQHNALNKDLAEAIRHALQTISDNKSVRALAITGRGGSFCVGGDLSYFADRFDDLDNALKTLVSLWQDTMQTLANVSIPVVVGIHGGVGGGALGLLWGADHIIAADNMHLATGFSAVGLTGDGGNSWYLPRLVGLRRAKEMLIENRVLDAATALDWGLINSVVKADTLIETVLAKAIKLSQQSLTSIAGMKRLLAQSSTTNLQEQLDAEFYEMIACASNEDVRIGMTAFLECKKPIFTDD